MANGGGSWGHVAGSRDVDNRHQSAHTPVGTPADPTSLSAAPADADGTPQPLARPVASGSRPSALSRNGHTTVINVECRRRLY
jgi:hypothetical protein